MFFSSLVPVFLLIVLGFALSRARFPGEGFWQPVERLTYYVLFPPMLVATLATAKTNPFDHAGMSFALLLSLLAVAVVTQLSRRFFALTGPAYSSVFQGAVRINTYVGFAIALGVYGQPVVATSALAVSVIIPMVNVMSVAVLTRHGEGSSPGVMPTVRALAKNPLILSCAFGITLNVLGWELPVWLHRFLEATGRAALPLGLMAVGAGLRPALVGRSLRAVGAASLLKLIAFPLIAFFLAMFFSLEPDQARAVLIFAVIPTSASSYVLAGQLGGDRDAMASIITAQTAIAFFTIPFWLAALEAALAV